MYSHLILLSLISPFSAAQPLLNFTLYEKAVLPWLTPLAQLPCNGSCDIAVLTAACSAYGRNGSQPSTPCAWGPETASTYISGCAQPSQAAVNCINFPTLAQARAACELDPDCGGVTSQGGGAPPWEMRAGHTLVPNGGSDNSSSLLLLNPQACHPSAATACNAFDSHGRLFSCPGGSCDCHGGSAACMRGRDIYSAVPGQGLGESDTDVYVAVGLQAPLPAWLPGIASGSTLFGSPEGPACYLPEVGNGYLATVPSWGSLHLAGLYNGHCGDTTKARLPSPVALSLLNATVTAGALSMAQGVYSRLWAVGGRLVEYRVWAHRARRHVLVAELELLTEAAGGSGSGQLAVSLSTLWDPAVQATGVTGNGCAGGFSRDFAWALPPTPLGAAASLYSGTTLLPSDAGLHFNVSLAMDEAPTTAPLALTPGQPWRQLVAIASSLDFPGDSGSSAQVAALAAAEYASAAALGPQALFAEHASAWAELQAAGIEVAADPAGGRAAAAQALDLAQHVNASHYFLLSSLREDVARGASPGGLATENYQGAVFMDQDFWLEPPLYLLAPALAAALLQSRLDSLPVMQANAALFGYQGAMAAWTAAYGGHPFGCCSGSGAYEDCLEQHVTGDVAVSVWKHFQATGNVSWLGRFFPLLAAIADFHVSRVSPPPALDPPGTPYHIHGVLPIDEWCVGSGCGCETPGVSDDAQMNAVAKLSLLLAARASALLGAADPRAPLWEHTGQNLVLLFNSSGGGHHDQFDSPTCPSGWGGSHYSPSHTVCPEDVLLLSYPLGDLLNTSAAATAADASLFIPITCLENAGMTTPMHTIVWLQLGQVQKAQAEFNRTLHAACYGPYNVRNEVDKHADIPGGHFDK